MAIAYGVDIKLFEELLEQEKLEEAVNLLKDYLQKPLTDSEQGGLYAAFALAYAKIKTQATKEYIEDLKEIEKLLKELNKVEQKLDDASNLDQVRYKLK